MTDLDAGDELIDLVSARSLAVSIQRLLRATADSVDADNAASPLVRRLTDHLGCAFADVLTVEANYRVWEHASLQRGVDAYLGSHSPGAEWFGISGADRRFESIDSMLTGAAALRYNATARLGEIKAPTLILHGRRDRSLPLPMAEQLHVGIAGSRLQVFRGGHMFCFLTERPAFLARVEEFLS